ncbi:MAG: LPS assembly protein LptD, partial [Methylococcaceae bacterium]
MLIRLYWVLFLFINIELALADNKEWQCNDIEGDVWSCAQTIVQNKVKETSVSQKFPKQKTTDRTISLPTPVPIKKSPVSIKPPQKKPDKSGWNCFYSEGEEAWNCRLKGADPEGKVLSVEDDNKKSFSLFSDAFDFQQEQDFQLLESRLEYNPWESCLSPKKRPGYIKNENFRDSEPMDVTADYSEVFDKEITSFFGNVKMSRADQKITADKASYDTVSDTMDVQGHVFYTENEISLHSDTALLNLATDEARLRNALFISPSGPLRGKADVVYRDSKVLSRYKNVAFTSCRPGNQDWVAHAGRFKMNKQSGVGSAKHAWLEFKGVPFFYTPYIAFPLDDRRMTGFLMPKYGGNNKDTGFDVTIPYYWNIAPNYDLTIWPRYMTKRGAMLGGEFRYQNKITEQIRTVGSVGVEYLPYDFLRDESRYSGAFRNHTQFTPNLVADIDLNYVSDKEYFDELSDSLGMRGFSQPQGYTNTLQGITQDRFLQSHASLRYSGKGVSFVTRAETYQTIDNEVDDTSKPYYKLPEVALNLNHSFDDWPIDVGVENEYINFYRESRTSGHRFNIKPFVSIPIESTGAFFRPKFSMQYTQYYLDNLEREKEK